MSFQDSTPVVPTIWKPQEDTKLKPSQACYHMPVILALRKYKFEASLGYVVRLCHKTKKQNKTKNKNKKFTASLGNSARLCTTE